jgi:hypothetical protein
MKPHEQKWMESKRHEDGRMQPFSGMKRPCFLTGFNLFRSSQTILTNRGAEITNQRLARHGSFVRVGTVHASATRI